MTSRTRQAPNGASTRSSRASHRRRGWTRWLGVALPVTIVAGVVAYGLGGGNGHAQVQTPAELSDELSDDPAMAAEPTPTSALLGCWDIVVDLPFPMGEQQGELCFSAGGDDLSARIVLRGQQRPIKSLHVEPGRLRMTVVAPIGEAKLAAKYTDTTMKGTFAARRGTRPFRGRRKAD